MLLTGKKVLNASPAKVWEKLMDTDTLARIMPGISTIERIGENSFISTVQIKLGPVNGSFSGNMQLEDITEQRAFTIKVQQTSKVGNANAAVKVNLLPVEDTRTELEFNGDVKLSGLLAGMGQRVIGGVSNTLTNQFFTNLEKELASSSPEAA
ncbi:CoxG family protein [Adhaeribacter radiodurans]|uniref:Carbon monoxide dehydrogenase subunit G n=1 Tax=Adhaeribacter radiodurans TaxID=2745197 RepID=A0A7L7L8Y9_9BACT|nr:carbon monoxide dehydrogenase subunit G [Adhaeribacter radiodurans]QMU29302.1 carbon monoxide dehydrogenase subunit G [Adhaeribacter radiodurans]